MTRDQIKNLPNSPGVYHFLDKDGAVLYVGKAKNLKNRLKQYFLKELNRGPAIAQMVQLAFDIKTIETESEIEAVILEAELIKKLKPKYNVKLKDDKSFLVIKITKDDFPLVSLERYKNVDTKDKSAWYFGPYPAGELLKKSLHYLRKVFPYRDCSKTKFGLQKKKGRTCIYGDIRVCTGPCADYVNKKEYKRNINFLMNFLKGKKAEVIKKLESEMAQNSKNKRFEEAANIRNQLMALKHLNDVALGLRDDSFEINSEVFKRIECYDISNLPTSKGTEVKYCVGSMVVFTDGKKDTDQYRQFKIKETSARSDLERLQEVLQRRFKTDWPKPDLVIIDGGNSQLNVAKKVLNDLDLDIPLISISKGAERKNNDFHFSDLKTAQYINYDKNLKNIAISARDEAHRFAIQYYRKLHEKEVLGR